MFRHQHKRISSDLNIRQHPNASLMTVLFMFVCPMVIHTQNQPFKLETTEILVNEGEVCFMSPVWSPQGHYLIAMITEDDGHDITGSEIYAIDITTAQPFR